MVLVDPLSRVVIQEAIRIFASFRTLLQNQHNHYDSIGKQKND